MLRAKPVFLLFIVVSSSASADELGDAAVAGAALTHFDRGLDALEHGRSREAILELRRTWLLRRRPMVLLELASAYERAGERELAAKTYENYQRTARLAPWEQQSIGRRITVLRQAAEEEANVDDEPSQAPVPYAHQPPESAAPDRTLSLRVQAPVNANVKLYLAYRSGVATRFTSLEMKRHGIYKVASIPASAVSGRTLQYFIEARQVVTGQVVYRAGDRGNPNLVFIE